LKLNGRIVESERDQGSLAQLIQESGVTRLVMSYDKYDKEIPQSETMGNQVEPLGTGRSIHGTGSNVW
jgi:hypothetical protein